MKTPEFVHLHLHSQFSLLDGAVRLVDLLQAAAQNGMPAAAVTDHGNLFCAVSFFEKAREVGIQPIVGCEMYVAPGSRFDRAEGRQSPFHTTLLVETNRGYKNLLKLVSAGYLEGFHYKPRIDLDLLSSHSEGLIALSGCLKGEVASHLLMGDYEGAREAALRYRDILGSGRFFLEIQDQGLPDQKRINPSLVRLSKETGIPLVATNDCHYLKQEDAYAHEVLLCIQTGKTMNDETRLRFGSDQFYFKSAGEMAGLFREIPESLAETVRIAERCRFELETDVFHLPEFTPPEGMSPDAYFRTVAEQGFEKRLVHLEEMHKKRLLRHSIETYRERLKTEMDMIVRMKFPGYFLVVWDFIRFAREQGIPVGPGRGSAAGSLVAYSLGITDLDPLQYGLLFERFLNPDRVNMPDIDIDFCMHRRSEVIDYVTKKYGRKNVSQIITFGTMAARGVIRDVGRAMDLSYAEADRIARLIPEALDATIEKSLQEVPQLKELVEGNPVYKRMIEIALKLEGLNRHASIHAAGVVIAPRAITEYAPLFKTAKDEITTQYDMNDIEKIGLLKMDFLGLKTLTVIDDAVKGIEKDLGRTIRFDAVDLRDEKTFELFGEGRTLGIFQFESNAMQDLLRRFKPARFEELIALNALYRPGPIKAGMVDEFIKRRHGKIKVKTLHPLMKDVLEETYGVMVYQEQVMRIASVLAGFSLGEADILRRAMGKKKKDVMIAQREKFVQGAERNKISASKANEIFEQIEFFAGYGFNKSHSAAYALIAFQTAYLKAHYPVYFMAALLTSEQDNTKKMVRYISECRDMGLEVLPPDINESDMNFTVVGQNRIRFGLKAIKNVGEGAVRSILEARKQVGHFGTLNQFCEKVDLRLNNKRVIESLIKSGSMDSLRLPRHRLFQMVDPAIDSAQVKVRDRSLGQVSLFGDFVGEQAEERTAGGAVPEWAEKQRLDYEKETLGFYITGHPLAEYGEMLRDAGTVPIDTLAAPDCPPDIKIGGIVASVRSMKTKKGSWMCYFVVEDMTGIAEVTVFPELFSRCQAFLNAGIPVFVAGRREAEDENVKILASDVLPLENLEEKAIREVRIRLSIPGVKRETLEELYEICSQYAGLCPLVLEVRKQRQFHAVIRPKSSLQVRPCKEFLSEVRALLGEQAVDVKKNAPAQPAPSKPDPSP